MLNLIKQNKLVVLLVIVIAILLLNKTSSKNSLLNTSSPAFYNTSDSLSMARSESVKLSNPASISLPSVGGGSYSPTTQTDRLVIQESNMSLVVKNVRETSDSIVNISKEAGGFMVNQYLSQPQDAPYATVTVRVPSIKLSPIMDRFRELSLKVTSENIQGTDVTDEYVDIDSRLTTLNKTKAKFEDIMSKAITVPDTLSVQRELINLQDQIDSLKGRQDYLQKTTQLSKITVHLSTDEFSLPYAPSSAFRPEAIFKNAVRSLIGVLRGLGEIAIWGVVFSVIWIPAVIIYFVVQKYRRRKPSAV